jgi:hypothetical protein
VFSCALLSIRPAFLIDNFVPHAPIFCRSSWAGNDTSPSTHETKLP